MTTTPDNPVKRYFREMRTDFAKMFEPDPRRQEHVSANSRVRVKPLKTFIPMYEIRVSGMSLPVDEQEARDLRIILNVMFGQPLSPDARPEES